MKKNKYSTVIFQKEGVGIFYDKSGKAQNFTSPTTTTVLRELYFNR